MSDETARAIDDEIRAFVNRNYQRAEQILKDNMDILHAMKDALMHYETIDALQIDDLMARREVRPPSDFHGDNSSKNNEPPKSATKKESEESNKDTKPDLDNPSDATAE